MLPILTIDPPRVAGDHAADHGLGQEEGRPVEVVVGVVGGQVVVEERYRSEHPGGVDQQRRVGVLAGQLLLHPGDLVRVGEIGGDAPRLPGGPQGHHGLVDQVRLAADDDRAAAPDDHVLRGLPADAAAAADHDQLAISERLGHDESPSHRFADIS
jgi:hypothetical protein